MASKRSTPVASRTQPSSMLRAALGIWVCGSLTAWIWGPFGTYIALDTMSRLTYWVSIMGLGTLVGLAVRYAVSLRLDVRAPRGVLLTAALQSLTIGPAVWAVNQSFFLVPEDHLMTLSYHIVIAGNICFIIGLVRLWAARANSFVLEDAPLEKPRDLPPALIPNQVVAPGPMVRRAMGDLEGEIMHVRADGHYTVLNTPRGSARVLVRFSDAVGELGALDGLRVHRSHWVARRAIARVEQEGTRRFIVMPCGGRVPVSRTYHADLPDPVIA